MDIVKKSQDIPTKDLAILHISDESEWPQKYSQKQEKETIPSRYYIFLECQTTSKNLLLKHIEPLPPNSDNTVYFIQLITLANKTTGKQQYILCLTYSDARRVERRYANDTNLKVCSTQWMETLGRLALLHKVRRHLKLKKWDAKGAIFMVVSMPEDFDLIKRMYEWQNEEYLRFFAYMMFLYKCKNENKK